MFIKTLQLTLLTSNLIMILLEILLKIDLFKIKYVNETSLSSINHTVATVMYGKMCVKS